MKIFLVGLSILCGTIAAQDTAKTTTPPPSPAAKQAKKAQLPPGIPKDAVETTPGFYRWTDKAGKAWTYRLTPFGVTRWPAESVDVAREQARKDSVTAGQISTFDQGDSVRFEQTTPFGKHTWVRKKSEMTASEQRIWDEQQKKAAAHVAETHAAEKE